MCNLYFTEREAKTWDSVSKISQSGKSWGLNPGAHISLGNTVLYTLTTQSVVLSSTGLSRGAESRSNVRCVCVSERERERERD